MSKTVSELAQELGLSKQYLNRILSQNNLGRKIGNQKTETKSETEMETSFRYVREQLDLVVLLETWGRGLSRGGIIN